MKQPIIRLVLLSAVLVAGNNPPSICSSAAAAPLHRRTRITEKTLARITEIERLSQYGITAVCIEGPGGRRTLGVRQRNVILRGSDALASRGASAGNMRFARELRNAARSCERPLQRFHAADPTTEPPSDQANLTTTPVTTEAGTSEGLTKQATPLPSQLPATPSPATVFTTPDSVKGEPSPPGIPSVTSSTPQQLGKPDDQPTKQPSPSTRDGAEVTPVLP